MFNELISQDSLEVLNEGFDFFFFFVVMRYDKTLLHVHIVIPSIGCFTLLKVIYL